LAAAQQRSGRPAQQKLPCFVYIDECHSIIRRDPKIATILDECRSQKIGLILAHQRPEQIKDHDVLSALTNCAIRFANSDDDAKYLSDKLRTTPEFLRSLPRGTFGAFVRDLTASGIALQVPYHDLSRLPRMTFAEQHQLRERMRAQFSFTSAPPDPGKPPPAPAPLPSVRPPKASPPATPTPVAPKPAVRTDPDRSDAGEPTSDW
jgi:hypothetical protein